MQVKKRSKIGRRVASRRKQTGSKTTSLKILNQNNSQLPLTYSAYNPRTKVKNYIDSLNVFLGHIATPNQLTNGRKPFL